MARPVIVTTKHRAVVFGYTSDTEEDRIKLKGGRWAIYWGTTKGINELAETGPTDKSKIGARADIEMRDVTAVIEVTPEAVKAWEAAE